MNANHDPTRRRLLEAVAALAGAAAPWPICAQPTPTPAGSTGTALVLSSGGCRGYAHIGLLRVLDEYDLKPDLIVGSSAGSLVGALYAAGMSARKIENHAGRMDSQQLREWTFPNLGVFSGDPISRFVNARLGARAIESLPTRYAAMATDLHTGAPVVLARGDLATAVQASSSAPGLVEPVTVAGKLCVDGNLVAPLPVAVARHLGASRVIACDVTFPPAEAALLNPFDALYQGFSILTRHLALQQRGEADVVIAPAIAPHNDMSAATVAGLIRAGEVAARQNLDALRALLSPPAGRPLAKKGKPHA